MNKDLIDKARCILDFMEESDALISEARRNGDMEREEDLFSTLSDAEHDLKACMSVLLGEKQDCNAQLTGNKPPF